MSDEIRVDYDELEQCGNDFESSAQKVADAGQTIAACYMKLIEDKGWIGLGSDAFANEMQDDVFPSYWRLHECLEDASRGCKQIADTVKQAEQDASALFR
jgi:WXG100 family type VII secretion target